MTDQVLLSDYQLPLQPLQEINWREVGSSSSFYISRWKRETALASADYKFGVSADVDRVISSGVIWSSCIDYLNEGLL